MVIQMIKWYYNKAFLENEGLLFGICILILILIVLATIYFDYHILKRRKRENK